MSNELQIIEEKELKTAQYLNVEVDIYRAIKNSLFPDASDRSIGMYLSYCRAKNYDPLKKPMHIVPIKCKTNNKDSDGKYIYESRDIIMQGINSYRIDASRSGQFYGISDTEYGPIITKKFKTLTVEFPEWCRLTIYKKIGNDVVGIPAKLYWLEAYATRDAFTDDPNKMWAKRQRAQLEKCTEALAYRKGFPEETGSIPTHEEMEGREYIDQVTDYEETKKPEIAAPLSLSHTVDPQILQIHLDAIKNSATISELQTAYNDGKKVCKDDKTAGNAVHIATKERKEYLKQLDAVPAEVVKDDFVTAYENHKPME